MTDTSFKRGLTVCDVVLAPDGWTWLALVSVDKQHPMFKRSFVVLGSGHTLTHVLHSTGDASHDARWWFMVGDSCMDPDVALQHLQAASDELTAADGKH